MIPTEPIRPLKDVWLRPRRVFRELATRPIGITDYLLGCVQGIVNALYLYGSKGAGTHSSVEEILANAFIYGAIAGVVGLFLMAAIYVRLGTRAGGKATTTQVVHVLAYAGVPMVAALAIWVLTALLVGDPAFVKTPGADIEGFLALLLHLQSASFWLLSAWTVVLLVMGFSEIQGIATRKSFGVWILGQLVRFLAYLFLAFLLLALFPELRDTVIPQN